MVSRRAVVDDHSANQADAGPRADLSAWSVAALERAFRLHALPLTARCTHLVRDRALAEDVVQELFVRLWQDPQRYEPQRGSLRAYLLVEARGRCIDRIRSEAARRRREERAGPEAPSRGVDPVEAAELHSVLDALPAHERDAIELAYLDGHTQRQAAVLLGVPEGTAKARIRRGLERLRVGLGGPD